MEKSEEKALSDSVIPRAPVSPDAVTLGTRRLEIIRRHANQEAWASRAVIGLTLHNNAQTLRRALVSAINQLTAEPSAAILILDDASDDNWEDLCADILAHPRIAIARGHCGSPARARNAILDLVDLHYPQAEWVCRLDADDAFTTPGSLAAACALGRSTGALFVLGGNRLRRGGQTLANPNPANQALLDPTHVLRLLEQMALGQAENELPSCNLLIRARSGLRYPNVESAEDHFLVARLLITEGSRAAILEQPYLLDYSLDGDTTAGNRQLGKYTSSRTKLWGMAKIWTQALARSRHVLGVGSEAIVVQVGERIEKRFYPHALNKDGVNRLVRLLARAPRLFPEITFHEEDATIVGSYDAEQTSPADSIGEEEARQFLLECERAEIVCLDIKRSNFRRRSDGTLMFVDFGSDVRDFTIDYFLDSAARLYAISALRWPDDELKRRKTGIRTEDALDGIPGFARFFGGLMRVIAETAWGTPAARSHGQATRKAHNVTLLIKCCAMDARDLGENVRHIVGALCYPTDFAKRVLLIDPYEGPFLRQHNPGDMGLLRRTAEDLVAAGWLSEIWTAPSEPTAILNTNMRWFGASSSASHSASGVPVSSQVWAFDRTETRYVLQCDVDVLFGRNDWEHSFLEDMLAAISAPDVVCVAFNIPRPSHEGARPYQAPPGGYVPEVRCGLLDCDRIKEQLPLPNSLDGGRLKLTWYRSLEQRQHAAGLRTLRGGDPRSFYLHPNNVWKIDTSAIARVRERIAIGALPTCQVGAWDLAGGAEDWMPRARNEDVIVLVKGRNTPPEKTSRCFQSLRRQNDQSFGIIVVDDYSTDEASMRQIMVECCDWGGRLSYARNSERKGHLANIDFAVRRLCANPDALIAILDMDDAFMNKDVTHILKHSQQLGHDLVWAGPFRPEKPCKSYHPLRHAKPAMLGGDDVWIHLRSFRRDIYDKIDQERLKTDGSWIGECTDYALMIPLAESAKQPVFIPRYFYWHERSGDSSGANRERKDSIIRKILNLSRTFS